MPEYELIGYIGEPSGDEDTLVSAPPVVKVGSDLLATNRPAWVLEDLKPVGYDNASLRRLTQIESTRAPLTINEGESVWVAGHVFVSNLLRFPEATRYDGNLKAWRTGPRGSRWTVGRPEVFRTAIKDLSKSLAELLLERLSDAASVESGVLEDIVLLYESVPIEDTRERQTLLGLYYKQSGNERMYRFLSDYAVRKRLFVTPEEFNTAVANSQNRLRRSTVLSRPALDAETVRWSIAAAIFAESSRDGVSGSEAQRIAREAIALTEGAVAAGLIGSRTDDAND